MEFQMIFRPHANLNILMLAFTLIAGGIATAKEVESKVLLTIHLSDGGDSIELTDEDLMKMDRQSFTTTTLWTEEPHEFSGPSLHHVLQQVGADPDFAIDLIAANDYKATLDPDVFSETYPIVANRIDGRPFTIREKGPLWVMFPFDQEDEYKSEVYFGAAVWQLTKIELRFKADPK